MLARERTPSRSRLRQDLLDLAGRVLVRSGGPDHGSTAIPIAAGLLANGGPERLADPLGQGHAAAASVLKVDPVLGRLKEDLHPLHCREGS
jgi:hypothetical protein